MKHPALSVVWLATAAAAAEGPIFTEITRKVGIDFVHEAGAEGKYVLPEIMGAGAAFLDVEGDGDLDVYLVQSGPLPESGARDRPANRLFHQNDDGSFTDITVDSGLGDRGYGTGVAVGDIDNDGLVDVYGGKLWARRSLPQRRWRQVHRGDAAGRHLGSHLDVFHGLL